VFAVLRGSPLRRRLVRTLEGEAGLNDPVAVLLVVGFTAWIQQPGHGLLEMAGVLVLELAVGTAVGLAVGRGAVAALSRLSVPTAGLYPVGSIAAGAIAFGAAGFLHGSGFLAVYLAGLSIASAPVRGQVTIAIFHQGAAWLAQTALFLTLGLLVHPSRLGDVWLPGTALALFLVLLARPAAVFAATALDRFTTEERIVLSWAGLRGGVPVVLATFPVIAHVPGSTRFFDVVFFAVVFSTIAQGATMEGLARALGAVVTTPRERHGRPRAVTRPWTHHDGDPAHPVRLDGVGVVEHLRDRGDAPGALVLLQDGRHAITGTALTVGGAARLQRYAVERRSRALDRREAAWWEELARALAG
jgi:cell volume regulation protein A